MKKTILYKEIDGYKIITGMSQLSIEPIETSKKIKPLIDKLDDIEKIKNKQKELNKKLNSRHDLIQSVKVHQKNGDITKYKSCEYEIMQREEEIIILDNEMKNLLSQFQEHKEEIRQKNLVYFDPKNFEKIVTDKEALKIGKLLIESETNNFKVDIDGEKIKDFRGVKYIKDGKIIEVTKLGKKPGKPLLQDVSSEDYEKMRIDHLTSQEKDYEMQAIILSLVNQAANMKSTLEIQGDPDALQKSQDWYNAEIIEMQKKYGTTNVVP